MKYSDNKNFSTHSLRQALSKKSALKIDYTEKNMGCAIETFEEILEIIHNEHALQDTDNCDYKCIAHSNFGIQLCEEMYFIVRSCCSLFEIGEIQNTYMLRVYARELEAVFVSRNDPYLTFQDMLGSAMATSETQMCYECKKPIKVLKRWITSPEILAISVTWEPLQHSFNSFLLSSLETELFPQRIMKKEVNQDINKKYIFRCIICYHYKHYSTFVYIPSEASWYQIDDAFIKKMPNFQNIIDLMIRNDSIPVLLIYENDYGQYAKQKIIKINQHLPKEQKKNNSNPGKNPQQLRQLKRRNKLDDRSCLDCQII
jgi:hypothetical protein